ncbi:hypothetical protein [Catenulispora rubra]|uniref:hypothetical protein n=1 Tax=Catenulispora rubra TaxID=280293 RepID=UPI0018920E07|nr:hypothetical protein [Catenulispora rubra]
MRGRAGQADDAAQNADAVTAFLAELGTKLADRWVQALLLPGLLWAGLAASGFELGQNHPFDLTRLSAELDRLAARPAAHAPGTVVLASVAVTLAGTGIGLAASAGGVLVQRVWTLAGDLPPASWLLAWRCRRWDAAAEALKSAIRAVDRLPPAIDPRGYSAQGAAIIGAQAEVRRRGRRLARLGPTRPKRPTRIGDRFAVVGTRAAVVNGLGDLTAVWPRLWSVVPESLRADITAARTAYTASARLGAWGLLYIVLAAVWWPAVMIGGAVLVTAVVQGRAGAKMLGDLIETAADLHTGELATALGTAVGLTRADTGRLVMEALAPPT